MQELDADLLCPVAVSDCYVIIALSKIKHSNAGSGVSAARTFWKVEATGNYYGTMVCHDQSSRQHTRKVCGEGVLKVDVL